MCSYTAERVSATVRSRRMALPPTSPPGAVAGALEHSASRTGPISAKAHEFWISLDRIKDKNIMKEKHKQKMVRKDYQERPIARQPAVVSLGHPGSPYQRMDTQRSTYPNDQTIQRG